MRATERLKRKTAAGGGGCIVWIGSRSSDGYGRMWFEGRLEGAHRAAWTLANGPIPHGLYVLHRCDRRACVNVDHLFLGSHQENMNDMAAKGRRATCRGEFNGRAKLTESDVFEIRKLRGVFSQRTLAKRYGVSKTAIRFVQKGRNWKPLSPAETPPRSSAPSETESTR